ncbi:MAG: oligosaccharide flippase family protein [Candidatus Thorarchaeota archaeon SMTZ1-83]
MPQGVRKGTFFSLLGFCAGGAFLFLFNVIAARTLGPSGYGVLNVLYSMTTVIVPLIAGGIRLGVARFISAFEAKQERAQLRATMRNSLVLLGGFLLLFLIAAFILKDFVQDRYLNHSLFLFLIFVFSVFVRSFVTLARGVLQGLREFKFNAITIGIEFASMLLLLLVLVLLLGQGLGGACSSILGASAITLLVTLAICYRSRGRLVGDGQEKSGPSLSEFLHFVAPVALANFLSLFLFRVGPFLIKTFGQSDVDQLVGLFAATFAIVSAVQLLVRALSGALFPNLSRVEAMEDVTRQKRYVKNSMLFMTLVCTAMILILWLIGPQILRLLYGKAFILRRLDFVLIAAMGGFYFLAQLASTILLAKGFPKEALTSWAIGVSLLILFVWFTDIETLLRVEIGLCLANFTALLGMLIVLRAKMASLA